MKDVEAEGTIALKKKKRKAKINPRELKQVTFSHYL